MLFWSDLCQSAKKFLSFFFYTETFDKALRLEHYRAVLQIMNIDFLTSVNNFLIVFPYSVTSLCKECCTFSSSVSMLAVHMQKAGWASQGSRGASRGGGSQHMCKSFNCGWRCLVLLRQHFLNPVQKSFQLAIILDSLCIQKCKHHLCRWDFPPKNDIYQNK